MVYCSLTDKRWKRVPAGTFAGKKITVASTEDVDANVVLASEFMLTVFDLEPGDYAISDESDLLDFTSFFERDTGEAWRRIEQTYGLTQVDVGSGRLVQIFKVITGKRCTQ